MYGKKTISYAAMPLAIVALCWDVGVAQSADYQLMQNLSLSKKIIAPKVVLKNFVEEQEETEVIVLVKSLPDSETAKIGKNFSLKNEKGKKNVRAAAAAAIKVVVDQLDPSHIKKIKKFSYVNGFSATVTPEGLQELIEHPNVDSVEKNRKYSLKTTQGIPLMNATAPRSTYKGTGVSVAVIDSGVDYMHPDLGGAAIGSNPKVIGGYDHGDSDADPMPNTPIASTSNSHGTFCAGIVAGLTSTGTGATPGDYIGGVAPEAKLYALKVNDSSGKILTSAQISAIEWAVTEQKADPNNPILIASISISTDQHFSSACDSSFPSMKQAIDKAIAAGITVFASSGNDNNKNGIGGPACISEVISVGAVYDADIGDINFPKPPPETGDTCADSTTQADKVTCYSNSAPFLDLLAPSHNAATLSASNSATYTQGFGGTSAATPYAAGAAAVLQSAAKTNLGRYLTPHEVKMYLTKKGDPIKDNANQITTPRVNLANAVAVLDNCGLGRDLPANTWLMTAPSCDPSSSISVEYNELGTYTPDGVTGDWVAWKWDIAGQQYAQNAGTDALLPGKGNWLYSNNAATPLKVSGTAQSVVDCSIYDVNYDANLLGKCFVVDLTPSDTDIWQMVGYPFSSPLAWADVRVAAFVSGTWKIATLEDALLNNLMAKEYWTYTGNSYEAKDGSTTGMIGTLEPQESFWVQIKSGSGTDGFNLSSGDFKLLIPQK